MGKKRPITETGLTLQQENFCTYLVIEGLTQRQAYVKAFGKISPTTGKERTNKQLDEAGCKLRKSERVAARCEQLLKKERERIAEIERERIDNVRDRIYKMGMGDPVIAAHKWDGTPIEDDGKQRFLPVPPNEQLKALRTYNEMCGTDKPQGAQEHDNNGVSITLRVIGKDGDTKQVQAVTE